VARQVGPQLRNVARLIKARASLQTERAAFVVKYGGWDTHSDALDRVAGGFQQVSDGLAAFRDEMKKQGVWDDVVVLTMSEFGRTITPNNQGTDHAWAGNVHLVGGGIKGGQILGQYPTSLEPSGDFDVGRGRMLPTTPWEAIWNPNPNPNPNPPPWAWEAIWNPNPSPNPNPNPNPNPPPHGRPSGTLTLTLTLTLTHHPMGGHLERPRRVVGCDTGEHGHGAPQ
jgi:hypothetical protein